AYSSLWEEKGDFHARVESKNCSWNFSVRQKRHLSAQSRIKQNKEHCPLDMRRDSGDNGNDVE
ncbi:hypothetical protein, partial [Geobacillus stearothermophilus]|uniref:hypothetical protein n=1 Tax=Geobacillus stearothermophilus TaxID=1422 RepID=UPI002E203A83|nr:hypothetical protein [Geobacillus stearothermophilus]